MTIHNDKIPIIILAGGKGERFVSEENLPKQLAKVSNHPIIIEIMLYYFKNGFNFFVLPLGYKKKFFINFFLNKKNIAKYKLNILSNENSKLYKNKINILFFNSGVKSNKLNRIYRSLKYIKSKELFGVCYGDIFANITFRQQLSLLKSKKIYAVLTGYNERSPYGHLNTKNKLIIGFKEKPVLKDPINIGFYFFKKQIFKNMKFKKYEDLETHFLPKLSRSRKIALHMHKGYHFTVNTQKDLAEVKKIYKNNKYFFSKL